MNRPQTFFSSCAIAAAMIISALGVEEADSGKKEGGIALDDIEEFVLNQRSTSPLPGCGGRILVTLDDITRGQVMTSLSWKGGEPIVINRSLREREVVEFDVEGRSYKLRLERLNNYLAGTDSAEFKFWEDNEENNTLVSEGEKIVMLIAGLESLDAIFIRNGKEYSGVEAADHIRKKYQAAKDEIPTAEVFIRTVAAKSSVSQKPYKIRMSDGTETTTEEWLGNLLVELEEATEEKEGQSE